MSEELKPCPACDYTNCFRLKDEARKFYCHCPRCGMAGPCTRIKEEAITAWNALPRHSDIKRVERERDWLVERVVRRHDACAYPCKCAGCPPPCEAECIKCWLKAASEAVEEKK